MEKYHNIVENMLEYKISSVNYEYPWNRFFEIRVNIGSKC